MTIEVTGKDSLDSMTSLTQGPRAIPILHRADVAVVGGGVAGIFAALGAAREGAATILIDRFGGQRIGGCYSAARTIRVRAGHSADGAMVRCSVWAGHRRLYR